MTERSKGYKSKKYKCKKYNMPEIIVQYGDKSKLAKEHKCTIQTVRFALKGVTTSELADKIRESAIEMGGIKIKMKRLKQTK